MKTLLIDNYDSYTYNIFQIIAAVSGEEPVVVKNDACSFTELQVHRFDQIIISPGPGWPDRVRDMGLSKEVIEQAQVPVLGICLGHQGIAHHFGANIVHAPEVMHGRLSRMYHNNDPLFREIPQETEVVRYHSLIVERETLPKELEVIAWTKDETVMGLRHRTRPLWAVQYHPESICTAFGKRLLENFCEQTQIFHQYESIEKARPKQINVQSSTSIPSSFKVTVKEMYFQPAESVFQTLFSTSKHAFWLDSSKVDQEARYSFMGDGTGPHSHVVTYEMATKMLTITYHDRAEVHKQSIFTYLAERLRLLKSDAEWPFPFHSGYVGYFGYELKSECNKSENRYQAETPDAIFLFADRMIVFDHLAQKMYAVCLVKEEDTLAPEQWFNEVDTRLQQTNKSSYQIHGERAQLFVECSKSYEQYVADIDKIKSYLKDGETYELNYTTRMRTKINVDPLNLYQHLRAINPAPYAAYMHFDGLALLSSSPEKFVTIDRDGHVCTKPIKGTMRRGTSSEEDLQLKRALETSEKDRAENLMIVDLLRNDLGKVCQIGSVYVPRLMEVESFQTVHQLVSTVIGTLKEHLTALDCVKATFPGGSMTGAPKVRTMDLIDALEGEARGIYSGAIGYFSLDGAADFNIVIRTIVLAQHQATIGVGGAVTVQSTATGEYEEMLLKAAALIQAMEETSGS